VGSRKVIRLKYVTAELAVTNSGWLQIGNNRDKDKSPTVDCGSTQQWKARRKQRHSREEVPDPQDGHEIGLVAQVHDDPDEWWQLQRAPDTAHQAFNA
jgi:hypothetical protein